MKSNTDLRFTLPEQSDTQSSQTVLSLLQGNVRRISHSTSPEQIDRWAREAAQGLPDAQFELAKALTAGTPLSANNRTAVKWLKKAADKQHAASQHMLGILIARAQGVRADPPQAVALFRQAAIMGNMQAQYDLARALSWGFGCEKNEREALTWFRLSGAQGHGPSQLAVGIAYTDGIGCELDLRQAIVWLRKAALNHEVQAAYRLGLIYLRPDSPLTSNEEAFRWMAEAARAGLADAQYRLALFYWAGRAVTQNYAAACDWARRSAAQDNPSAVLFLSRLYEKGLGCPADRVQALALVKQAAQLCRTLQRTDLLEECLIRDRELSAGLSGAETEAAQQRDPS